MQPETPQDPFQKFWAQVATPPPDAPQVPATVVHQLVGTVTGNLIIMGEVPASIMQMVLAAAQKPTETTRQ